MRINREISRIGILMLVGICILSFASAHAETVNEAKTYLLKVFNGSYVIPANNARIRNKLTINKCDIAFSFTINGAYDRQSCNMKYLDANSIQRSGNSINIVTINEENRVQLSNFKAKSAVLSLGYDANKYSEDKIIASFKKVIGDCGKSTP